MKKYECSTPRCQRKVPCALISDEEGSYSPICCPHSGIYTGWRIIEESKEEAAENECPAKAELPDWCKVGAIGYDNQLHEYFKIINIDNDTVVATRIESSCYSSYQYFNEVCSEARKRPFNDKEMKALVGKVIEDGDNLLFVSMYYGKEECVTAGCLVDFDRDDLMRCSCDGKPCYKLEHLNDKGEWVE